MKLVHDIDTVSSQQDRWHHLLHPSIGQNLQSLIPQTAIIDCRMGSNPFGPPMSLDHLQLHVEAHTYLKPQASDELSYSLGRFLDIDPAYLSLNGGSTHSMSILISRLLKPLNKTMLGVSPQYTQAISEWVYFGGHYHSVPLLARQDNTDLLAALIQSIIQNKPDVLFLDNPNNPTGYFFEINEIFDLIQVCNKYNVFCIIDEAYIDYIPKEHSAIHLVPEFENLIVTRSFSKGMGMAALRIGYTVAQPHVTRTIQRLTHPFSIATPSLYIAQHVLDHVDLDQYLQQSGLFAARSKYELINACTNAGFHIATTHPNIPLFIVSHSSIDPEAYFQALHVIVTPGRNFNHKDVDKMPLFARIRVPESERELHQLCKRIIANPLSNISH